MLRRALLPAHRQIFRFSRNMAAVAAPAVDFDALRADLKKMYDEVPCQPIMVRIGWHDAGTYCAKTKTGGANASIRFDEMAHPANAGLKWAEEKLEPFKTKYPGVSYADLYQLASCVAIEHTGGPIIDFKAGRKDATKADCTPDGRLPDATKKSDHLRDIFYRMGFNDQEIVALSGAHALGRCHKDRSGFEGAWTAEPNTFDNEYFKNLLAPADGLLILPTDAAMVEDDKMKPFVEKYAEDQEAFFKDYAAAHKKLSELGAF